MDFKELHRRHIEAVSRGVGAALDKTGFAALVVHSGTPQKRTDADDQYWSLRPTPHFQHWLPLAEPGCLLIAIPGLRPVLMRDRKSTRLNSSHLVISYAVFCLQKKTS